MILLTHFFGPRATGPVGSEVRASLVMGQRLDSRYERSPEEERALAFPPIEATESALGSPNSLNYPAVTARLSPAINVVLHSGPRSVGADRLQLLQLRLDGMQTTKGIKRLLITSPLPEEGKSTVALNLATQLAKQGQRPVLLVEADVFRPSLCKKLGLDPWRGLTDCQRNSSDPKTAIRRIEPLGFHLSPAGSPSESADGFLSSAFVSQFLERMSPAFDWILIDSPPTIPVAEVLALKAHADATLLVVRAKKTQRGDVEEAIRILGRDHILGIVLNGVEGLDKAYSAYYGYAQPAAQSSSRVRTPAFGERAAAGWQSVRKAMRGSEKTRRADVPEAKAKTASARDQGSILSLKDILVPAEIPSAAIILPAPEVAHTEAGVHELEAGKNSLPEVATVAAAPTVEEPAVRHDPTPLPAEAAISPLANEIAPAETPQREWEVGERNSQEIDNGREVANDLEPALSLSSASLTAETRAVEIPSEPPVAGRETGIHEWEIAKSPLEEADAVTASATVESPALSPNPIALPVETLAAEILPAPAAASPETGDYHWETRTSSLQEVVRASAKEEEQSLSLSTIAFPAKGPSPVIPAAVDAAPTEILEREWGTEESSVQEVDTFGAAAAETEPALPLNLIAFPSEAPSAMIPPANTIAPAETRERDWEEEQEEILNRLRMRAIYQAPHKKPSLPRLVDTVKLSPPRRSFLVITSFVVVALMGLFAVWTYLTKSPASEATSPVGSPATVQPVVTKPSPPNRKRRRKVGSTQMQAAVKLDTTTVSPAPPAAVAPLPPAQLAKDVPISVQGDYNPCTPRPRSPVGEEGTGGPNAQQGHAACHDEVAKRIAPWEVNTVIDLNFPR